MTRAGWTIDNLHMLKSMIEMAIQHRKVQTKEGHNYFDRKKIHVEHCWYAYSQELCERDPAFFGAAIIAKCHAHFDRAHAHMMEFRARSCIRSPAVQFPTYFAACANKLDYRKEVARAAIELRTYADVAVGASMSASMSLAFDSATGRSSPIG